MVPTDHPGYRGVAARLPKKPGIQKLTPPSSATALLFESVKAVVSRNANARHLLIASERHIDPRHAHTYNNRGRADALKGEFDRAIKDYDRQIDIDAKHPDAYNSRGNAYLGKGDPDRAIEDFDAVIAVNPTHAHAYGNLFDRAIQDFDAQLEIDPRNANAYIGSCVGLYYAPQARTRPR